MLTDAQKASVRAAALAWLDTPYRAQARVRGEGVDCAQLLIGIYGDAGIIAPFDPERYQIDQHLHSADERYLAYVLQYAVEIQPPWELGDVLLFRGWKWPSAGHGAVYLGELSTGQLGAQRDLVIHAVAGRKVELWPLTTGSILAATLWKGFRFDG